MQPKVKMAHIIELTDEEYEEMVRLKENATKAIARLELLLELTQ